MIKEVKVTPFEQHWLCEMDGCDGEMIFTGEYVIETMPELYPHLCTKCKSAGTAEHAYPRLVYKPLG